MFLLISPFHGWSQSIVPLLAGIVVVFACVRLYLVRGHQQLWGECLLLQAPRIRQQFHQRGAAAVVVVGEGRRVLVAVVVLGRVPVLLLVLLLVAVVVVVSAVAGEQVAAVVVAAADVVPRSPFRLSIRLLVVLLVVEQEQGVVVVVVANSIPHFAGVVAIRFAPPVMLPLLPRSDSELVLPHSVHPMHFVLLHPQVSEFLETVKCTSDC